MFQAAPYPAPAGLDRDVAIIGELTLVGEPRSARWLPTESPWTRPTAASPAGATLAVMVDDVRSLRPLAATATATTRTLAAAPAGDPVDLVAQPPGGAAPWLVAGRTYRGHSPSPRLAAAHHTAQCRGASHASW